MLKICTALFVASAIGVILPSQAASQADIAHILQGNTTNASAAEAAQSGDASAQANTTQPSQASVAEACPQLAQLRTTDVAKALRALYRQNGFAPLWDAPQRLDTLRTELQGLADDGLIVGDYPFSQQISGPLDACAELRVSSEYLLALEHLGTGRLDQQKHEPMWRKDAATPAPPAVERWAREGLLDVTVAFEQARPDLGLYRELRALYVQLRDAPSAHEALPPGALLRLGMQDPRVPQLAARLKRDGYLAERSTPGPSDQAEPALEEQEETTLDPVLEDALKRFQEDHDLKADGVLGPATLAALNMTPEERLHIARINLERLRWINALRQDEVVLVNSAANILRHYQNDDVIWRTKIITGRPGRETPALVSQLDRITLNPDWTVPPTIRRQDMLPAIRKDLGYLKRKNLIVLDYQGNRLDPETIDWQDPPGLMIRQPPGPDNPLGQVVFRFDNPFSVYLHDTPDKLLFSRAQRNISSGCVRIENADMLAESLFSRMSPAMLDRVERQRNSRNTHQVAIPEGPQVILGYWTAEANADGRLVLTQDPYGQDPALLTAFAAIAPSPDRTANTATGRAAD